MRRRAGILICSMLMGLSAAGGMALSDTWGKEMQEEVHLSRPAETVAWWSLTYEMPNPEKLPVKVRFQWMKGLE